jgi:hypothetical protein
MSELSKILSSSFIVGASSVYGIVESAKSYMFPVDVNVSRVSTAALQDYTLVSSIAFSFLVCAVLFVGAFSEIATAIMQTITVFMVYLCAFGSVQDQSVHVNGFVDNARPLKPSGVPLVKSVFMRRPLPLIEPVKVGVINKSNLALSELDFFGHSYRLCLSLGFLFRSVSGEPTFKVFRIKPLNRFFECRCRPSHDGNQLLQFFDFLFPLLGKLLVVGAIFKNAALFFGGDVGVIACTVSLKGDDDFTVQRSEVTSGAQVQRFLDIIRDTYGCGFHDTILLPKWYHVKLFVKAKLSCLANNSGEFLLASVRVA